MLFQILKKDMLKRKGVNVILFLFITLATIFLSSSVNNILVVNDAVDYFIEYSNVPDVNLVLNSDKQTEEINQWLDQQIAKGDAFDYHYQELCILPDNAITLKDEKRSKKLEANSASLYLGTMPKTFNKVFDTNGNLFEVHDGEIALSNQLMVENDVQIGDTFILKIKGLKKEYTIVQNMKDAAFGNSMTGMNRFIVSENDYNEVKKLSTVQPIYDITAKDGFFFSQKIENKVFSSVASIVTKDTYKKIYSFDMIMAALLILVGVCLILIALLVLRFTLVFTIEEQYQEIGVLKAIGIRNHKIKKLYLLKYLAIVSVGAFVGMIVSIPIADFMVSSVNSNMVMENSSSNLAVAIICAIFVIILVLSFCYLCTRKLNKISAIMAIHGGENGERFSKRKGLPLYRRTHMPVNVYLGLNDILSHSKRYAVLIITFCISFILITIPLNTVNTMRSSEMVRKFLLDPSATVYVRQIEQVEEGKYTTAAELNKGIQRVKSELESKGYKAEMKAEAIYFLKVKGEKQNMNVLTIQMPKGDTSYAQYSRGSAPQLENEIAFSEYIMDHMGWAIGDVIPLIINGKEHNMIISGSYSDYMQLGKSARLNPLLSMEEEVMFEYWSIMVYMKSDMSQEDVIKEMRTQFPEYDWMSAQDLVDQNVGGIQNILDTMLLPMTSMLCLVIMLITLLMEKLFITREKAEIAMMKSIGFRYSSIRMWQIIRMSFVVLVSMMISIPLSLFSNQFLLKPIFAIMGAQVEIQVNALQAYVFYPGILLIGIIIATIVATHSIKHVDIKEMNNLE